MTNDGKMSRANGLKLLKNGNARRLGLRFDTAENRVYVAIRYVSFGYEYTGFFPANQAESVEYAENPASRW